MPHEHYMIKGSVEKNIEIEEDFVFRSSGAAEDDAVDVWNPDRPLTDDLAAFLGPDIGVARRYLPHGTLTSLYWLMVSQQDNHREDCTPSWSTFHRVWASVWHRYLKFRDKKQHADCRHCFRWRELLARCSGVQERVDLACERRPRLRVACHDKMI